MRSIKIRIQHLEERILPNDPVGILGPAAGGGWRLALGKKERYFSTQAEGVECFHSLTQRKKTRFEPVLIIWGYDDNERGTST